MTNIQPTQEQKELAEGILNSLTAPGSVKNNMNLITVTRLIAEYDAEQREVLQLIKIGLEVIIEDDFDFGEENAQINGAIVTAKDLLDKLNTLLK